MGIPGKQAGHYYRQVLGSREGSTMGVWKVPEVGMGMAVNAGGSDVDHIIMRVLSWPEL